MDNAKNELLPGAYSEVHFRLPVGSVNAFELPANVLLFRGDGMQRGDGRRRWTDPHEAGHIWAAITGPAVEIVQGLNAQDNVVLSPPDSLTEGAPVHVAETPARQGARS